MNGMAFNLFVFPLVSEGLKVIHVAEASNPACRSCWVKCRAELPLDVGE